MPCGKPPVETRISWRNRVSFLTSIPAAWPRCRDFFGILLVIEPSPGQLSGVGGLLTHSAKTAPGKAPQGPWDFGGLSGKGDGKLQVGKGLRRRGLSPRGGKTVGDVVTRFV